MKKLIAILSIILLTSFTTSSTRENYALIGTINDFMKLKGALMKDSTNKDLIKWIDTELKQVNLKR